MSNNLYNTSFNRAVMNYNENAKGGSRDVVFNLKSAINSPSLFSSESPDSSQSPSSTHSANQNLFDKDGIRRDCILDSVEEPLSLDSLELPEIAGEPRDDLKRKNSNSGILKAKKARFRPCDGCRKRKTKCVIPDNTRSCVECTKRNQGCEYDNEKVFLFNNVNSLSGMAKLMHNNLADKLSSKSLLRTKPCDGCKKKRSKCIKANSSTSCQECEKRNIICTFSQNVLNVFPSTGKVNLLANNELGMEKPVKDYSLLKEPTVMASSLSLLSSKSTIILGESSMVEKKLLCLSSNVTEDQQPSAIIKDSNTIVRKVNDQYFRISDDNENFITLKYLQCDEIEEIIGENNTYLIDLYFRLVHQDFPILSKQAFYERYCRNYREIHPLLLVSVYLLALNWWELNSLESEATIGFVKTEQKPDVKKLENVAVSLMQDNFYETLKFSVVQALLLLMNYSFTCYTPYTNSVWKVASIVSTMAQEIGLNWPCETWKSIPKWERKLRKIVSWAVVFHEKLYSLFEGKLSNINLDQNWLLDDLNYNDFLLDKNSLHILEQNELMQKNEKFKAMVINEARHELEVNLDDIDSNSYLSKLIFMETMKLSNQIDRISRSIYSVRSLKFDTFDQLYDKSIPLIKQLQSWFQSLPSSLRLVDEEEMLTRTSSHGNNSHSPISGKRFSLISNGSLNLLYYTLLLIVYKRLVNKYIDQLEQGNNQNNITEAFKLIKPQIKELLQTIVYKFLFNLKPFSMELFWLLNTERSLVFVGTMIALLVKILDLEIEKLLEDDQRAKLLQDEKREVANYYRDLHWKLSIMAPDFNHARVSLKYLDTLIVLREDLSNDNRASQFVI